MTFTRNSDAPAAIAARQALVDRWLALRRDLDTHYGTHVYPFAVDRILNHARARGGRGAPPSALSFEHWSAAEIEAAIVRCERHRRHHPRSLPEPPPRQSLDWVRHIDPGTLADFLDLATAMELPPDHVVAIAVHDLLAHDLADHCLVLDNLDELRLEIEFHGNLPDPVTVPRAGIGPHPCAPWTYVPGRPAEPLEDGFAVPRSGDPWPEDLMPAEPVALIDRIRARLRGPAARRRDRWLSLCSALAIHYRWYGYPTAEARIFAASTAAEALRLPDDLHHSRWTARETTAAIAHCQGYLERHPDALPPFPARDLRHYNPCVTSAQIARFATRCEDLRLEPEDAIVIALHERCAATPDGAPWAMATLDAILEDIDVHGNVLDPAVAPEDDSGVH